MENTFFNSALFTYVLIPLFIFIARICDVSIGTLRIIFVSKGKRNIAPVLGFFEILIWITAISKIMQNLDNYVNYVAYAAGFATGNYVGMIIEEKLAMGIQMIRVFAVEGSRELVEKLNSNGYGTTLVEAQGTRERVDLVFTIFQRNELKKVLNIINENNPKSFYTIEDIKSVNEGIFAPRKTNAVFPFSNISGAWRKGK